MKHTILLIIAIALMVGCKKKSNISEGPKSPTAQQNADSLGIVFGKIYKLIPVTDSVRISANNPDKYPSETDTIIFNSDNTITEIKRTIHYDGVKAIATDTVGTNTFGCIITVATTTPYRKYGMQFTLPYPSDVNTLLVKWNKTSEIFMSRRDSFVYFTWKSSDLYKIKI